MKGLYVKIKFKESLLGSSPADPDVYKKYIATKAPDYEDDPRTREIEAVGLEKAIENAMTIFPRNSEGQPILWPYQVKGFFKSAQKVINDNASESITDPATGKKKKTRGSAYLPNYKGRIDTDIFIYSVSHTWRDENADPGIVLHLPEGASLKNCQRPLRAETMQGPRVALANSESAPAGTWCQFVVIDISEKLIGNIRQWLEYGKFNGIGQWRNSGRGQFLVTELKEIEDIDEIKAVPDV